MAPFAEEIKSAEDHHASAELLIDRYPLLACEHLLSAVIHAAKAAKAGWSGPIDFAAIPAWAYRNATQADMTKLTGELRRYVREGNKEAPSLAGFSKAAAATVEAFIRDMETLGLSEAPTHHWNGKAEAAPSFGV